MKLLIWVLWTNLWDIFTTFSWPTASETALRFLSPHTAVLLKFKLSAAASECPWAQDRDSIHQRVSCLTPYAGAFPPCTLFVWKASSCGGATPPTAKSFLLVFSTAEYAFWHRNVGSDFLPIKVSYLRTVCIYLTFASLRRP